MVRLTPREHLCLQWAAAGKTSYETGIIIGISKRTVDYHLYNACEKLGVHSRRAAVAVALGLGLFPDINALLPNIPAPPTPHTQPGRAPRRPCPSAHRIARLPLPRPRV